MSEPALKFKPKDKRVRLVFTSDRPACMTGEPDGKVYAVIGPLAGFTAQTDLQDMLTTLVRGWNLEETP